MRTTLAAILFLCVVGCYKTIEPALKVDHARDNAYIGEVRMAVEGYDKAINICIDGASKQAKQYDGYAFSAAIWRVSTTVFGLVIGATGATLAVVSQILPDNQKAGMATTGAVVVGVGGIITSLSSAILDAVGVNAVRDEAYARYRLYDEKRTSFEKEFARLDPVLRDVTSPEIDETTAELSKLNGTIERSCGATGE